SIAILNFRAGVALRHSSTSTRSASGLVSWVRRNIIPEYLLGPPPESSLVAEPIVRAHLDTATGPRAVPGWQRPRTHGRAQADSTLLAQSNALRAEDGSRSGPRAASRALVAVSRCAPSVRDWVI